MTSSPFFSTLKQISKCVIMTMKRASRFLHPRKNSQRKSVTYSEKEVEQDRVETEILLDQLEEEGVEITRPKYRSECPVERPCPFVGCRYHLFLDITDKGTIKFNFYGLEPWELKYSCALDIADEHPEGLPLTDIGDRIGLTRERIRQIEKDALKQLADSVGYEKLKEWLTQIRQHGDIHVEID